MSPTTSATLSSQLLLRQTRAGAIACLVFDNPPVNAINSKVRRAIDAALDEIEADARVSGVVISAAGSLFSGGGDLREMGKPEPPDAPTMTALTRRIETFAKPVVAALNGKAIGGGVLFALACHARAGTRTASIALPEVRLGFAPGAGGTQRLPRLIGIAPALEMIALARTLQADEACRHGFFDLLVDEDGALLAAAVQLAQAIAGGAMPWRRTAALAAPVLEAGPAATQLRSAFLARAALAFPQREAPRVAIDLVLGAGRHAFEEGMRMERTAFERLSTGPQAQALLHLFFAERAAARPADSPAGTAAAGSVDSVRAGQSRVVELVCTGQPAPAAIEAARRQARDARLLPVQVLHGSIAQKLSSAYAVAAAQLATGGVPRAAINAAAAAAALPLPFPAQDVLPGTGETAVRETLLQSFVDAARACMAAGMAQRPGDVDLIAVECCGFPALRGGPLFYADTTPEMPT